MRKIGGWFFISEGGRRWRRDLRCGIEYPLWDEAPSECNPDSKRFCCNTDKGVCEKNKACADEEFINYRELRRGKSNMKSKQTLNLCFWLKVNLVTTNFNCLVHDWGVFLLNYPIYMIDNFKPILKGYLMIFFFRCNIILSISLTSFRQHVWWFNLHQVSNIWYWPPWPSLDTCRIWIWGKFVSPHDLSMAPLPLKIYNCELDCK